MLIRGSQESDVAGGTQRTLITVAIRLFAEELNSSEVRTLVNAAEPGEMEANPVFAANLMLVFAVDVFRREVYRSRR